MSAKQKLIRPTDEEEAEIQRGIALDPDNPATTDEEFARMRPAPEMIPEIVNEYLRSKAEETLPLDDDVLAFWRASGSGWQARANEALRKAISVNR